MTTTTQKNGSPGPGPAPAAAPKMKLVTAKGRQERPLWVHLYGVEGVGKTKFAADAPDVVFLDVEHGTAEQDVARFVFDEATGRTQPNDWPEALAALRLLATEKHDFKTVAIDTLDALEALIWQSICKRDGKTNIEDYGYGKGYVAALDEWRLFVATVERIRAMGINVVTTAHSAIKSFKNPEGDDYDRFTMKMNDKAGAFIKERADVVLFARHETFADKDEKTKRVRGVSSGARVICTQRTAAYDAKNRHDLPESMPLDWGEFHAAVLARRPADPKALVSEIERKAKEVGGEVEAAALAWATKYADKPAELARMNDKLNAKLAEKQAATQAAQ